MANSIEQSYDRVPYLSNPFAETHPRHLEAVAHLYGLAAPAAKTARVLELGCGVGGNLVPMAYALPEARFLGVDLSGRQIEMAKTALQALELRNIEFQHMSIADLTPQHGQFDYIICHGVFSWVPAEIRRHIFRVCQENLSELGVAYISFNTYPGWHRRQWAREIMMFHAQRFATDQEKVGQARAILKLMAESPLAHNAAATAVLKAEFEQIADKSDHYILHEYLEDFNEPMYFRQFMEEASGFDLQYLADARLNGTLPEETWPPARQLLGEVANDIILTEQYADFLRNRMFRRAVLVKKGQKIDRAGAPSRLSGMYIASTAQRDGSKGPGVVSYSIPRGLTITTNRAPTIAIMDGLIAAQPAPIHFDEVCRRGGVSDDDKGRVAKDLTDYWMAALIEIFTAPIPVATEVAQKPVVSPIARFQLRDSAHVTSLRHGVVGVDGPARDLALLCDGSRSREELVTEMSRRATFTQSAAQWVDQVLMQFARSGILVP